MEIPQPVRDHLKAMLGSDYHQYLDSFAHSYGQTLRINRLKVKPADIIRRFLLEKRVDEVKYIYNTRYISYKF